MGAQFIRALRAHVLLQVLPVFVELAVEVHNLHLLLALGDVLADQRQKRSILVVALPVHAQLVVRLLGQEFPD